VQSLPPCVCATPLIVRPRGDRADRERSMLSRRRCGERALNGALKVRRLRSRSLMDELKDASDRKCWSVLVTANMLRVRNGWTLLLTDGQRRGRLEHGGSVQCAHYSLAAKESSRASRSSLRWVTMTKLTGFDPQTPSGRCSGAHRLRTSQKPPTARTPRLEGRTQGTDGTGIRLVWLHRLSGARQQ
jgi:hypothetical protein